MDENDELWWLMGRTCSNLLPFESANLRSQFLNISHRFPGPAAVASGTLKLCSASTARGIEDEITEISVVKCCCYKLSPKTCWFDAQQLILLHLQHLTVHLTYLSTVWLQHITKATHGNTISQDSQDSQARLWALPRTSRALTTSGCTKPRPINKSIKCHHVKKMSKCHNSIESQKYNMYKDMRVRVYNVIYTTWISIVSACFSLLHFVSLCPFTSLWHYHQGWVDDNRVAPRWCLQEGLRVSASLNRISNYHQLSSTISIYPWFHDISRHWMTRDTDARWGKCFWCLMNSQIVWVFHCSICCMLLALFFTWFDCCCF